MNIGFDLDKIFINPPPYISGKFLEKLEKHKTKNHELFYRIPSKAEQLFRLATHTSKLRKPITENLLFLQNFDKKAGNKYYLITGRFGFLKKNTEKLIQKYNFNTIFEGMYFNYENEQPHHFKDMLIKHLHLDQFVDDDLDLLQYLAKRNPQTIFFWFNKKLYDTLQDNLIAITKLEQIGNTSFPKRTL